MKKLSFMKIVCTIAAAVLTLGTATQCYAESKTRLMQSILSGENIDLYISNLGEYEEASGQIGRDVVDVVDVENNVSGRTVFLIDNSKSVSEGNLNKVKQIIQQYAQAKAPEEKVSIATFGENVEDYLIKDETDASAIESALGQIAVEDKETYLTDALYDELANYTDIDMYTRFVVVSDGVDNKSLGYTKEELSDYLKENLFPIFSIGCRNNSNEENLKNMFAISRLTKAGYYLLDDYESYEEIIGGLTEPMSRVQISIPDSLRDGSRQNILLRFRTSEGEIEVRDEMTMPFGIREPEPEPTEEAAPEPKETPTPEVIEETPVPTPTPEPAPEKGGVDIVSVMAIVLVAAAVLYLVLTKLKKKGKVQNGERKKKKEEKVSSANFGIEEPVRETQEEQKTVFLGGNEEEQKTVFLGGINDPDCSVLVVRDAERPDKVFRYPLRGRVIIGRKKDYDTCQDVNIVLNYDSSISGRHLAVSMQGNRLYIEDLNSSNGTFINGERIRGIVPVAPGCQVELGRVKIVLDVEA